MPPDLTHPEAVLDGWSPEALLQCLELSTELAEEFEWRTSHCWSNGLALDALTAWNAKVLLAALRSALVALSPLLPDLVNPPILKAA